LIALETRQEGLDFHQAFCVEMKHLIDHSQPLRGVIARHRMASNWTREESQKARAAKHRRTPQKAHKRESQSGEASPHSTRGTPARKPSDQRESQSGETSPHSTKGTQERKPERRSIAALHKRHTREKARAALAAGKG
jgi:hypothetical protein